MLFEHAAYGADGQPLAATFIDYLLPTTMEMPPIEIHHLHRPPTPDDPVPYRGVGEGGAIGAPAAVVSAIEDALGIDLVEQHLPPARVWALLRPSAKFG